MAHTLTEDAKGVYIIAATPFRDDGALDLESIDSLVDFYLERGVNGMTILGIMGEANKLSPEESRLVLERFMKRIDDRIPVVVGLSAAGLGNAAQFAHAARDAGACGVMAAPAANCRTEAQVEAYFAALCDALGPDVPVVFQDFPQTTGVYVSAGCLNRIFDAQDTVVMLKHEEAPGLNKITQIRKHGAQPGKRRVSILVGNGGIHLPQELARGVDGAMTGFGFPEMLVKVVSLWHAGRHDEAEDLYDAYLPYVRHEQQLGFGLAIRKEVLVRQGAIASNATRAPGPKLSPEDVAEMDRLLARLEQRLSALPRAAE